MNTAVWDRKTLKARGKAAFKLNYWRCVLVSLILAMLGGGASFSFNSSDMSEAIDSAAGNISPAAVAAILGVALLVVVISVALTVFVLNPLTVGCTRFYVVNTAEKAELSEVGFGFSHNYLNIVKTIFVTDLYICLWSLLFVIPGIVKSYSYRMVPYLMSENPELTTKEAIDMSREMMNGHKWNAFVLDLSFIGWIILSVFTLGILVIFYVAPYIDATNAELYQALKPVEAEPVDEYYTAAPQY